MQLADLKFKDGSKFTSLLDLVFPIGSTYMSMGSASPDTLFGGTWSKVTGGVLALAGTSGYAAAGAAGGSKKISVSQMPSHAHLYVDTGKFCWNVSGVASAPAWGEAGGDTGALTGKAGGLRTTICRPTSPCTCGSAQHRGDSLCSLRSRAEARTKCIARSLSEGSTSASSTARRRVYGPVRHGSASHPGRSLPQVEARRQAITLSARREGRRASCFPLTKSPTINTPFLTATIREAVRNSVSISSAGLTCFGLIRSLVTLVADNLMRTGRRTSPSICGKELNKEVAA